MTRASTISRRRFVANVGCLASAVPLVGSSVPEHAPSPGDWDLSWMQQLATATDRAVFDWPSFSSVDDIVPQIAARFLDNCAAAYAPGTYKATAVLNARTAAIAAGMTDAAWSRYALGAEYNMTDPATKSAATRNPFWSRPPEAPANGTPTLQELVQRGAIILVCDFAMGHLSARLAAKTNQTADAVHQDLRRSLVPGAYAVPSGIFGLSRAQNSGCAFIRM
jgi:intracellular sulfur oxidation DsrE/DsrF family protein